MDALEALRDRPPCTPRSCVPFAAQSRELPVPYSSPREDDERHALRAVLHRGVVDRHLLAVGLVQRDAASRRVPSAHGTIRFLMRTLANVPRIITSWLPRREP